MKFIFIMFLIFAFSFFIMYYLYYNLPDNYLKYYPYLTGVGIILLVLYMIRNYKALYKMSMEAYELYKKNLEEKYNNFTIKKINSEEIILDIMKKHYRKKARRYNDFSFSFPNYNCIIKTMEIQYYFSTTLIISRFDERYSTIARFINYQYDLPKDITEEILEEEIIKRNIENLKKKRTFSVKIKFNKLIISKRVRDFNRKEKYIIEDINDVGVFYEKIVKEIIKES